MFKNIFMNEENKSITKQFILSRILIYFILFFVSYFILNDITAVFSHFDAYHYFNIGVEGYTKDLQYAFFPLFPCIIGFFNYFHIAVLGTLIFDIVLSYLSTLLLYKISRMYYEEDKCKKIVSIWIYSPIALFTCVLYTESLFIFLTLLAFYMYKKRKPLICGILIGLSVCARSFGAMLFFSILFIILYNIIKNKKITMQDIIYILKIYIPATIISCIYPYYLYIKTGNPLYFVVVQYSHWSRKSSNIFTMLYTDFKLICSNDYVVKIEGILNAIITIPVIIIFVLCIVNIIRKEGLNNNKKELILFMLLSFIAATKTMRYDGSSPASCSLYRYILSLFPIYMLYPFDNKNIYKISSVIMCIYITILYALNIFVC